jgi:nucleoside 2-deoxyribosyltransferase
MASPESPNTGPKPFVLVLMPFKKEFNDTYTFGIKGAAEDVAAYAERIDEQAFQEGILDRVFNQINKADVIVADMTGQNPNVFYEVGYAHALNKIVVLLTRTAEDIPFDLKQRQHIVYSGEIATLRSELAKRLTWAIQESRQRGQSKIP